MAPWSQGVQDSVCIMVKETVATKLGTGYSGIKQKRIRRICRCRKKLIPASIDETVSSAEEE
jgi:hypothetical protein